MSELILYVKFVVEVGVFFKMKAMTVVNRSATTLNVSQTAICSRSQRKHYNIIQHTLTDSTDSQGVQFNLKHPISMLRVKRIRTDEILKIIWYNIQT